MAKHPKKPPSFNPGGSSSKGGALPYGTHRIGVPDNYKPNYDPYKTQQFPQGHYYQAKSGKKIKVRSRYNTGSEWALLAGRSPEEVAQIQQALGRTGMLNPKKFQPGTADKATRAAFSELLGEANARGMRWGDYLDERVQLADETGYSGSTAASAREALSIQLSNPDTIKAQVTNDATNLLGSSAAAGDPNQYVDQIHQQETQQQTDQYNQTGANGTGGTTVDPASVDALLVKNHPVQAGVNQLGQNAQKFIDLLGQSSGMQGTPD